MHASDYVSCYLSARGYSGGIHVNMTEAKLSIGVKVCLLSLHLASLCRLHVAR